MLARLAVLLLAAGASARCDSSPAAPGNAVTFSFEFASGTQGWVSGFADYPAGQEAFYELTADYRALPASLDAGRSALYISGNNHSDDLFMFYARRVDGLQAGTLYEESFEIEIATDVPSGCGGVGGSPGESVYVKAGAGPAEPTTVVDASGQLRLTNFDKGNQAVGGANALVLGNVANSQACELSADDAVIRRWELKTLHSPAALTVRADQEGAVWLLVGTDSGFEAVTSLYYTRAVVTLTPVS